MHGGPGGHRGECGLFSWVRGAYLTQSHRQARLTTSWLSELRAERSEASRSRWTEGDWKSRRGQRATVELARGGPGP